MLEGLIFCMETMNLEYESACKMRRLKSPIIAHNRQTRPEPRASNACYMFTLKMQSLILKNAETVSYLSLLFENKFQDIDFYINIIKCTLINMLCVFKKTLW